jgi:hypothetical protein
VPMMDTRMARFPPGGLAELSVYKCRVRMSSPAFLRGSSAAGHAPINPAMYRLQV